MNGWDQSASARGLAPLEPRQPAVGILRPARPAPAQRMTVTDRDGQRSPPHRACDPGADVGAGIAPRIGGARFEFPRPGHGTIPQIGFVEGQDYATFQPIDFIDPQNGGTTKTSTYDGAKRRGPRGLVSPSRAAPGGVLRRNAEARAYPYNVILSAPPVKTPIPSAWRMQARTRARSSGGTRTSRYRRRAGAPQRKRPRFGGASVGNSTPRQGLRSPHARPPRVGS